MKLKAIDFFCGIGGMSYGLKQAGIDILGGIDFDPTCHKTYEENLPGATFINSDIRDMNTKDISKKFKIHKDDKNLLFIGCSPCQYWTKMNTIKSKSFDSRNLLHQFYRFIEYYLPGYILIENVPGILKRQEESQLDKFLKSIYDLGYKFDHDILDFSKFGIPQKRIRYVLIASRHREIKLPIPKNEIKTLRDVLGEKNGFYTIPSGFSDKTVFNHSCSTLTDINIKRLELTPHDGGNRYSWKDNPELQINAYKNKDNCFRDVYGRMYWDKPAPTITTRFNSISNGRFAHPEENRGLSIREGATLQTFDKIFIFYGKTISETARHIGNAVPPKMAQILGEVLTGV